MDDKEAWRKEERLKIDVVEVWNEVQRHIESEKRDSYVNKNSRWKTIRIFVSSTFKDFHTERDALVKEVFPELREWCQKRYLNLVECDLRWGVPEETPNCITLQICLDEIRRCEQENMWPFFLNMISKRIGWIPLQDELTADIISDFNLIIGLSATEMEIVEAAYRKLNPNSLFMWRDESFLKQISDENVKKEFLDDLNPLADRKLAMLKQHVKKRFPEEQICIYSCNYIPGKTLPHSGRTKLQLNPLFKDKVLAFFKMRIEQLYVHEDEEVIKQDKYDLEQDQHNAFMQQRASTVIGRNDVIEQIVSYVMGTSQKPLILLGASGSGKSTIMAKALHDISEKKIEDTTLFFHFVGAVPRSTSLLEIMKRFIHLMKQRSIPSRANEVFEKVRSLLLEYHNEDSGKVIIFIDALDQLDSDDFSSRNVIYSWLPKILPKGVKCIFSMIPNSTPHMILKEDAHLFQEELIKDLTDLTVKDEIVSRYLMNFRKKLDTKQTLQFLNHSGSSNPLWLITACEELRCYGEFKNLTDYIKNLPSTLDELLLFVLNRICQDIENKDLLKATICLMECSKNGLLEVELLEMLPMFDIKTDVNELDNQKEMKPRLISWRWGIIYRQLKTFIRPYGDSGEGRLNFYHKSMSKVVREKFLELEYDKKTWKETCHSTMALYFKSTFNIHRKIEEYPYHLIELGQMDQLKILLMDWEVIELLFDSEWSKKLIEFWRLIDVNYASLKEEYLKLASTFQKHEKLSIKDKADRIEIIARILCQAGLLNEALQLGLVCSELLIECEKGLMEKPNAEDLDEINKSRMYISGFLAHIETVLNRNYKKAIELHNDAIERNSKLSNQHDYLIKRYKALQYIKKAFCMSELALNMRNPLKRGEKNNLMEEGKKLCMEATLIYREIKDYYHELEVNLTRATLCKKSEEAHEILRELMKDCKAYHGVEHSLMMRALHNDGTEYESEGKKTMAYNRFKGAYLLSKHLYGPGHNTTVNYLKILHESKYIKIAKEKNECPESTTFDPNTLFAEG